MNVYIILCITICQFVICGTLYGYNVNPDMSLYPNTGGTHEAITDKTFELDIEKNILNELIMNKADIKTGTTEADAGVKSLWHFYNPTKAYPKDGLLEIFGSAKTTAQSYYENALEKYRRGNTAGAWRDVGQALHLLQDMASPSHANAVPHKCHYKKNRGYEWWVSRNWKDRIIPYLDFVFSENVDYKRPIIAGELEFYFFSMASFTNAGGYDYDLENLIYTFDDDCERYILRSVEGENAAYAAASLLPSAIRIGGGFLTTFCKNVNCTDGTRYYPIPFSPRRWSS